MRILTLAIYIQDVATSVCYLPSLVTVIRSNEFDPPRPVLKGAQVRGVIAAAEANQAKLARLAKVSPTTIQRMAAVAGEVVGFEPAIIKRVVAAMEALGWELIEHEGRYGIIEKTPAPKRRRTKPGAEAN